jgi:hypothetical protein
LRPRRLALPWEPWRTGSLRLRLSRLATGSGFPRFPHLRSSSTPIYRTGVRRERCGHLPRPLASIGPPLCDRRPQAAWTAGRTLGQIRPKTGRSREKCAIHLQKPESWVIHIGIDRIDPRWAARLSKFALADQRKLAQIPLIPQDFEPKTGIHFSAILLRLERVVSGLRRPKGRTAGTIAACRKTETRLSLPYGEACPSMWPGARTAVAAARTSWKSARKTSFRKKPLNPLISLDSDERIQGNPRKSNRQNRGFSPPSS